MKTPPEPSPGPAASTSPRDLFLQAAPGVFVLLWATGFIGAKYGLPYAEPLTFLFVRFVIVSAILAAAALAMRAPWPKRRADWLHSLVTGVLIHGCYLGGVFLAISRGMPAGVTALIVGVQPLLTAFVARFVLNETLSWLQWLGMALGLVGLGLVLAPSLGSGTATGFDMLTIALNIVALVGITAGTIYQKRFGTQADLRSGNALQYLGASLFVGLGVLLFEDGRIEWTGDFLFALGWLVIVLSVGAVTLLMILIRHGAVSRVAALFYLVPPVTALIAWAMFGETLTPVQLAGMAVTAFSVWLASRATRPA